MNKIPFLILIFLTQCITIYNKDKIILDSQKINSINRKTEKDIFTISHSLKKEGLTLFLDGYRVEEENQVDFIKDTFQINKTIKNPKPKDKDKEIKNEGNSCKDAMFVLCLIVGVPVIYIAQYTTIAVLLIELPTLPFRLYPEEKTRIREEIKKGKTTNIGKVSGQEKVLTFLDRNPNLEYIFTDNKIFIPLEVLELEDSTKSIFNYQIINPRTREVLSAGNFDLSEEIISNKEVNLIISKNKISKHSLLCKNEYPFLENKEITYSEINRNIKEFCRLKYTESPKEILHIDKYNDCLKEIKSCYEITRYSE